MSLDDMRSEILEAQKRLLDALSVATAEITLVCLNSSRACGFERCTSIRMRPPLVTSFAASLSAYE